MTNRKIVNWHIKHFFFYSYVACANFRKYIVTIPGQNTRSKKLSGAERQRRYLQKIKEDPLKYQEYLEKDRRRWHARQEKTVFVWIYAIHKINVSIQHDYVFVNLTVMYRLLEVRSIESFWDYKSISHVFFSLVAQNMSLHDMVSLHDAHIKQCYLIRSMNMELSSPLYGTREHGHAP